VIDTFVCHHLSLEDPKNVQFRIMIPFFFYISVDFQFGFLTKLLHPTTYFLFTIGNKQKDTNKGQEGRALIIVLQNQ
jgi:hypothetical protein